MIIRTLTYRVAIVLALVVATLSAYAEPCHKNMLVIPDGSSYVSVDQPKQMPTGALTMECWAMATANVQDGAGLIEYGDAPVFGAFGLRFGANNQLIATLRLNIGVVTLGGVSINNPSVWHHYAVTFIPGDSICMYVDGVLVAGMATTGTSIQGSYNTLFIGHSPSGGASFVGDIDELRIWNVARTVGQIAASMNQPLTGKETGLVTYFKFDDDPAAVHIHDFSAHDNNATYTGPSFLTTSTASIAGSAPNGYMLASKDTAVVFPPLLCGTSAIDTVRVFNRGDEEIRIDHNGFLSGTIFSISSTSGFPLAAGDTTHYGLLIIQANVTNPGDYTDTLVVVSSTVCGGDVRVPVHIHKDVVSIAFQDSIFFLNKPYKLLNCNLPIERQTHLINRGSKKVTISSLGFAGPGPITILSPSVPFTIDSGKSQEIRFRVEQGPPTLINATLRATAQECPKQATMSFQGERISQSFSAPSNVVFPTVHDPAVSYYLYDTIRLKNTGTADLYFSPGMQLFGALYFRLVSPSTGLAVLRPDSTLPIIIAFNVAECGTYQTSLTLHLQDARDCPLDTSITITATVLAPDLATVADTIDLGAGCSSRDTVIVFYNRSGRRLTVGAPSFTDTSALFLMNSAALPTELDDGDSLALHLRFAPSNPGEYSIDMGFGLSPCGKKVVTFTGVLGVGKFVVSDSVIDLGTACDLSPQTATIQLKNLAGRTVTVNDSMLKLSNAFRLTDPPMPFTFSPGEVKTLTVTFAPTDSGAKRGEIWLFENGCYVKKLVAKGVREHANVAASTTFVEFGTTCPDDTSLASLRLTNLGHGDISIRSASIIGDTTFHLESVPPQLFSRGQSESVELAFVPTDTTEFGGILEVIFGPCGDTVYYALHGIGGPKPALFISDTALDFGKLRVGSPQSLCVTLTNPSCVPIPIIPGMFAPLPKPFSYASISVGTLIDSAHPITLCINCDPDTAGTFRLSDTIRSGSFLAIVTLKAKAIAPFLVHDSVIDFGSVPVNTFDSLPFKITNNGDAGADITFTAPSDPLFTMLDATETVDAHSVVTRNRTIFRPQTFGLQSGIILMHYENRTDTLRLRGRGVGPGPLFSVSDLSFGPVRVSHPLTKDVDVTADKPTTITTVRLQGANVFSVTPTGPRTISGPNDSIHYTIIYQPAAEVHDTTTLILSTTTSSDVTLGISGDGVEAHLSVSDSAIDFGSVPLRLPPMTRTLKIRNTGGYPLAIRSVKHALGVFGSTGDTISIGPIAAHSDTNIIVSFKPIKDMAYNDTLVILADAPEVRSSTALHGAGVFAPFGYPQISFLLPSRGARVGEIVDIPVTLSGSDLDLVDIDSFTIDINFDPTVVYFHDEVVADQLTSGWSIALARPAHDTIRLRGRGPTLAHVGGTLCTLRGEALLGPHDSSGLVIAASDPRNSADLQSSAGSFIVTDCGNYRGGIVFKGNYSLSKGSPSPATNIVTIPYELGLPAHVSIKLFDQLGRDVKTLLDADRGVGAHTLTVDLSDLPNGEYYYVLESLEYRASEKLMLVGH